MSGGPPNAFIGTIFTFELSSEVLSIHGSDQVEFGFLTQLEPRDDQKIFFSLKDDLNHYQCAGGLDTFEKILDLTRCDLILRLLSLGGGAGLLDCLSA